MNITNAANAASPNQPILAQVPIVAGLAAAPPQAPTTDAGTFSPEPVAAPVAAAALPSASVGERPTMSGNRLAANAAQGANLSTTSAATSTAFQNTLNSSAATGRAGQAAGVVSASPNTALNAPAIPSAQPGTQSASTTSAANTPPTSAPSGATPTLTAQAASATSGAANTQASGNQSQGNAGTPIDPSLAGSAGTGRTQTGLNTPPAAANEAFTAAIRNQDALAAKATSATATNDNATNAAASVAANTLAASPASAAATANVTSPSPALAAQVADGVISHAQQVSANGSTEFRLRIDPPSLGPVDVRLVADSSGDVRGHLVVSSDAARQLIETQLPDLQQRLTAAGISIQNFSVSADSSGSAGQQPRQEASPNPYNASYGQGTQSANRATAATAATSTLASEHVDVFA